MDHNSRPRRRIKPRKAEPQPGSGNFLSTIASAWGILVARQPQQTFTSYVYTTLEPSFTGQVVGYYTAIDPNGAAPTGDINVDDPQNTGTIAVDDPQNTGTILLPSAIAAPTTATGLASSLLVVGATQSATVTASAATTVTPKPQTSVTSQSMSTATSNPSPSDPGLTPATQAGLAVGIVLGVGALVSILIFCFRQRKRKLEMQRLGDEKDYDPNSRYSNKYPSARIFKTLSTAPRLSLRPVTQFLPNLGHNTSNNGQGNSIPLSTSPKNNFISSNSQSHWERPLTSQSQNADNPFGNHAQIENKASSYGVPAESVGPKNTPARSPAQTLSPNGEVAGGTAGFGLRRGASQRAIANPLDYTKPLPVLAVHPPSPTGTEFSFSSAAPGYLPQSNSAAAIAAAGGPQNSTVHRVQLDFKPSMEDELELQAGQRVRLLHEYDDGWALCIRLDRSEQGVVPRTCLSTRPVKPRASPNEGPQGPQSADLRIPQHQSNSTAVNRPNSPAMNIGGRASPSGPPPKLPLPKGPLPEIPQGRPLSPATGRPTTPASGPGNPSSPYPPHYGHERRVTPPNNVNQAGTNSPNGSPPLNVDRKPLPRHNPGRGYNEIPYPGQAL